MTRELATAGHCPRRCSGGRSGIPAPASRRMDTSDSDLAPHGAGRPRRALRRSGSWCSPSLWLAWPRRSRSPPTHRRASVWGFGCTPDAYISTGRSRSFWAPPIVVVAWLLAAIGRLGGDSPPLGPDQTAGRAGGQPWLLAGCLTVPVMNAAVTLADRAVHRVRDLGRNVDQVRLCASVIGSAGDRTITVLWRLRRCFRRRLRP
jgi:hypothetical protein